MKFVIEMFDAGRHWIEADYFEITEDGQLLLHTRGNGPIVAAFAGSAWASVKGINSEVAQ